MSAMTHSGHERLKIAALQTDLGTPFRRSQIPAVITDAVGVVLSLGAGNATARFHQDNYWISPHLAARGKRAISSSNDWLSGGG